MPQEIWTIGIGADASNFSRGMRKVRDESKKTANELKGHAGSIKKSFETLVSTGMTTDISEVSRGLNDVGNEVIENAAGIQAATNDIKKSFSSMIESFVGEKTEQISDKFKEILEKISGHVKGIKEKIKSIKTAYSDLAAAISPGLGAASLLSVGAILATSIAGAAIFQERMKQLNAVLDDTSGADSITESIKNLSKEFGESKTDLANSFFKAITVGAQSAAESISTVRAANVLADASSIKLEAATSGIVKVMSRFGESAGTAAQISDTLFVAMREGKTDMSGLLSILDLLAPSAKATGTSFDVATAGVASLTHTGKSAQFAIRGMRGILESIASPSKEAAEEAKRLGIAFDAFTAHEKGLPQFLSDVVEAADGSTVSLKKLFGGFSKAQNVLHLTSAEGKGLVDVLAKIDSGSGEAAKAADKLKDGLLFEWGQLKEEMLGVANSVGESLLGAVTIAATSITKFIRALIGLKDELILITKLIAIGGAYYIALKAMPLLYAAWELAVFAFNKRAQILIGTQFLLGAGMDLLRKRFKINIFKGTISGTKDTIKSLLNLKNALGVISIAVAGWQIGKYFHEHFLSVRLAGIALVRGLFMVWEKVKYGAQLVKAFFSGELNEVRAFLKNQHEAIKAEIDRNFDDQVQVEIDMSFKSKGGMDLPDPPKPDPEGPPKPNPTGGGGNDAAKEARDLQAEINGLLESYARSSSLASDATEVQRVSYELLNGSLKKATLEQRALLLQAAARQDQINLDREANKILEQYAKKAALGAKATELQRVEYDLLYTKLKDLNEEKKEELRLAAAQADKDEVIKKITTQTESLIKATDQLNFKTREQAVIWERSHGELKNLDAELEVHAQKLQDAARAFDDAMFEQEARALEEALDPAKRYAAAIEHLNTLRERGKLSAEAYADAVYNEQLKVNEAAKVMRDSFSGLFEDLMDGSVSVADAFKNMADNIVSRINSIVAEELSDQLMRSLFPEIGADTQGVGGLLDLFGGSASSDPMKAPTRAKPMPVEVIRATSGVFSFSQSTAVGKLRREIESKGPQHSEVTISQESMKDLMGNPANQPSIMDGATAAAVATAGGAPPFSAALEGAAAMIMPKQDCNLCNDMPEIIKDISGPDFSTNTDAVRDVVEPPVQIMTEDISSGMDTVIDGMEKESQGLWASMKSGAGKLWSFLQQGFSGIWDSLAGLFKSFSGGGGSGGGNFLATAGQFVMSLFGAAHGAVLQTPKRALAGATLAATAIPAFAQGGVIYNNDNAINNLNKYATGGATHISRSSDIDNSRSSISRFATGGVAHTVDRFATGGTIQFIASPNEKVTVHTPKFTEGGVISSDNSVKSNITRYSEGGSTITTNRDIENTKVLNKYATGGIANITKGGAVTNIVRELTNNENYTNGGSFRVGGSGGIDSQLVSLKAAKGSVITITRPEQESRLRFSGGGVFDPDKKQLVPPYMSSINFEDTGVDNATYNSTGDNATYNPTGMIDAPTLSNLIDRGITTEGNNLWFSNDYENVRDYRDLEALRNYGRLERLGDAKIFNPAAGVSAGILPGNAIYRDKLTGGFISLSGIRTLQKELGTEVSTDEPVVNEIAKTSDGFFGIGGTDATTITPSESIEAQDQSIEIQNQAQQLIGRQSKGAASAGIPVSQMNSTGLPQEINVEDLLKRRKQKKRFAEGGALNVKNVISTPKETIEQAQKTGFAIGGVFDLYSNKRKQKDIEELSLINPTEELHPNELSESEAGIQISLKSLVDAGITTAGSNRWFSNDYSKIRDFRDLEALANYGRIETLGDAKTFNPASGVYAGLMPGRQVYRDNKTGSIISPYSFSDNQEFSTAEQSLRVNRGMEQSKDLTAKDAIRLDQSKLSISRVKNGGGSLSSLDMQVDKEIPSKARLDADIFLEEEKKKRKRMNYINGGSFRVGGSGGIDSQLVSLKAAQGSIITITRPEQESRLNFASGGGFESMPEAVTFRATPNEKVSVYPEFATGGIMSMFEKVSGMNANISKESVPAQESSSPITVTNNFSISTPANRIERESQQQIAARVGRSIDQAVRRNT